MSRMLPDLHERTDLILSFARVLHVNGQSTDETLAASDRLGSTLGLRTKIIPAWGQLQLQAGDSGEHIHGDGGTGWSGHASRRLRDAVQRRGYRKPAHSVCVTGYEQSDFAPAPIWLFALAAAAGAAALAVIYGVQHSASVVLIA